MALPALRAALVGRRGIGTAAAAAAATGDLRWAAPPPALQQHRFLRPTEHAAFQVFAANTGTGKTVLTAGLVQAGLRAGRQAHYLKPIQTGYPEDSDGRFVQRHAPSAQVETLVTYRDAVGPHLAAEMEQRVVPDHAVLQRVAEAMAAFDRSHGDQSPTVTFLETAGGVNSPGASGTLQSDLYRPLRLPTVLIGDSALGGISTTLASLESLYIRGYDVLAVVMLDNAQLRNHAVVETRAAADGSTAVHVVPPPPPKDPDARRDAQALAAWYRETATTFDGILAILLKAHAAREQARKAMAAQATSTIWWPFTQHQLVKHVTVVDSAYQDHLVFEEPDFPNRGTQLFFDACGSWWTQGLGHGSARLALEAAHAAGRYGHVMFPENIHEPAATLASRALELFGAKWAQRVFFSDNGSTANEIALKMAFRVREVRAGEPPRNGPPLVLALRGSYHGDTLGAMLPSDPNSFNERVHWYSRAYGTWLTPPTVGMRQGKYVVDVPAECAHGTADCGCAAAAQATSLANIDAVLSPERWASPLAGAYRACIDRQLADNVDRIGACLIEPIVHGAGGMQLIDPLFQRELVLAAKRAGIPVIFDEVFVGSYRLGPPSTIGWLGVTPDIATYAKLISGGLVPLALTLTTEPSSVGRRQETYNAFLRADKLHALLHGHSYTANPVACHVATVALDAYPHSANYDAALGRIRNLWPDHAVRALSALPSVERVWALGTVLAVDLRTGATGYASMGAASVVAALRDQGVYARPLGSTIYLMATPLTPAPEVERVAAALTACLPNAARPSDVEASSIV